MSVKICYDDSISYPSYYSECLSMYVLAFDLILLNTNSTWYDMLMDIKPIKIGLIGDEKIVMQTQGFLLLEVIYDALMYSCYHHTIVALFYPSMIMCMKPTLHHINTSSQPNHNDITLRGHLMK